ncbi:hypothetical protein niasHT_010290 [Heterodera trifolii]|uniref:Uncharacterized protein n=1 Tax=Heterodera trifolii TaxID=157864 RepID=A0ABD2M819_9BILA
METLQRQRKLDIYDKTQMKGEGGEQKWGEEEEESEYETEEEEEEEGGNCSVGKESGKEAMELEENGKKEEADEGDKDKGEMEENGDEETEEEEKEENEDEETEEEENEEGKEEEGEEKAEEKKQQVQRENKILFLELEEEGEENSSGRGDAEEERMVTLFEDIGEFVLRDVDEIEEERKRDKTILKERMRRAREPHLRRKMVTQEPCIPWEYGSNKFSSQKGAGAFGSIRNATLKVHSSKELFPGDPTALPRWSRGTGNSQSGQTPFGMIREQVTRMVEHEGEGKKRCQELLQDPKQTERILKLWTQSNPEAKSARLFGSKRPEKMVSIGGREWSRHELILSRAALPRLACVNETSAARDGREAIRVVAAGTRQATMNIAGLDRTERDQMESNKCMSWLGGQLILQTQSGTGGFQTPRDVVSTSYYDRIRGEREAKEERQRKRREEKKREEKREHKTDKQREERVKGSKEKLERELSE